jgi:hypothetical protein
VVDDSQLEMFLNPYGPGSHACNEFFRLDDCNESMITSLETDLAFPEWYQM